MKCSVGLNHIIRKYSRQMLEDLAFTQRTGREAGFCASSKELVNCHGTKCEVFGNVPHRLAGGFCYHTHTDNRIPSPSTDDWGFYDEYHFNYTCIANQKGRLLCLKARGPGRILQLPVTGKRCEKKLVTGYPRTLKRGAYLRIPPGQLHKFVEPWRHR